MRWLALLCIFLAACTPAAVDTEPQCDWPEIPKNGGCCRDLNENNICDTAEFSEEIEQIKQQEYEEAAKKARETAEKSGTRKRTIINDLYDRAITHTNYQFFYEGDTVIVTQDNVLRKLGREIDLGEKTINGRRMRVYINAVHLDFIGKTAEAECIPDEPVDLEHQGSPCDEFLEERFEVPYILYEFKLPPVWLGKFLHRNPIETQPGMHIGKQQVTMYRFSDLQDAQRNTILWVNGITGMPLKAEVWYANQLEERADYNDLLIG